ncbi:MAG: helix-turn-helix transcriptional regulator [Stenotrophomonas lactitubi]|uniref:helix-turn-helix transcriptional regulator n=1 Tax=Stenotrophomonas lactitubi TaxID=2045214 RepID=UPI003D09718C
MSQNRAARLQFAINELVEIMYADIAERVCAMVEARISAAPHAQVGLRLLRMASVREKTGMASSTIYRKIQQGTFPRQATVGASAAWLEADVEAWIEQQLG